MPLRLTLKPFEKVFIEGAVIVNGDTRAELTLLNDVAVLRQTDILTEITANTACKRLYLLVQLMYMDTPNLADYHAKFWRQAQEILECMPQSAEIVEDMSRKVTQGNYYRALKLGKKLFTMEKEWMQNAE